MIPFLFFFPFPINFDSILNMHILELKVSSEEAYEIIQVAKNSLGLFIHQLSF